MSFFSLRSEVNKLQSQGLHLQAVELVTAEIKSNTEAAELYILRAENLLKLEKFKEAASDAKKAIDLGAGCDAHVLLGKSLFNLGKFVEAKETFNKGREKAGSEVDNFNQFRQWIDWSEERIKRLGLEDKSPNMAETESNVPNSAETAANVMPVPKIKHDWYQTETHVVVTILIKNQKREEVKVDFTEKTVSVSAPLPGGSEYSLELDLCHPVHPAESSFRVVPSKVEIKMKKVDCIRWAALEGDGNEPAVKVATSGGSSTAAAVPTYPSSSAKKHDWNKLEADIKSEEENEKLEGDAALNQLFQKIYSQGSDETRRAMNKSFMESGGTVLSTNWKEVATDKVDVKPPDVFPIFLWGRH